MGRGRSGTGRWILGDSARAGPVLGEEYAGIPAHLVLDSADGWDKPSGIAALDSGRLVVVTSGGLVELDVVRGRTSWLMRLPGCELAPVRRTLRVGVRRRGLAA